jgi:glycosyltransferase involved in cell wall biosynthesis
MREPSVLEPTVRLMHVLTVPESLIFLRGHGGFFRTRGFDLSFVTSRGDKLFAYADAEGAKAFALDMSRKISPLADAVALYRLWRLIAREHPAIVHAHTPKGGLLGMTAASLARVPVRVYHMRGLPMMTARGWRRELLRACERISCTLADTVICHSESLRRTTLHEGICQPSKLVVLHHGSNGVDAQVRFNPERTGVDAGRALRERLGIPASAIVIGFAGRLVGDKGVRELAAAFRALTAKHPNAHLLLVGKYEERDALEPALREELAADGRVHMPGEVTDMAMHYAAMDVFVLPTYREGFPNVLLEAAAMQLPIVATRVDGCVDAVADGETGLLVPARDARALGDALARYVGDPALRARHGAAGRARVLRDFDPRTVQAALLHEYDALLERANVARRVGAARAEAHA